MHTHVVLNCTSYFFVFGQLTQSASQLRQRNEHRIRQVAGVVFAFAVVVMPGIRTLPDADFLRAFQVIDRVIQDNQPLFLLVWVGSIVAPQMVGASYSYAYRFAIDGGSLWTYCDIDVGIDGTDGASKSEGMPWDDSTTSGFPARTTPTGRRAMTCWPRKSS